MTLTKLEAALVNTFSSVPEVCNELGIELNPELIVKIDTCSSCGLWQKKSLFKIDLDGNIICSRCWTFYGA